MPIMAWLMFTTNRSIIKYINYYTMKSVQNRLKRTGKLFRLELISFSAYKLQSVIKYISKHLILTILGLSLDSFVREEKWLKLSIFILF